MTERAVLFVDYQNAYMRARDAFHYPQADPHWMGQIDPVALGNYIIQGKDDRDRVLQQVRMYRDMPNPEYDVRGHRAARRQISAWERNSLVTVRTRPFRYPRNYPESRPQEKGIDVQIALDS